MKEATKREGGKGCHSVGFQEKKKGNNVSQGAIQREREKKLLLLTHMVHVLQEPRILIQHLLFQRRDAGRGRIGEVEQGRVGQVVAAVFIHYHGCRSWSSSPPPSPWSGIAQWDLFFFFLGDSC